jgi:hypothetical protein
METNTCSTCANVRLRPAEPEAVALDGWPHGATRVCYACKRLELLGVGHTLTYKQLITPGLHCHTA